MEQGFYNKPSKYKKKSKIKKIFKGRHQWFQKIDKHAWHIHSNDFGQLVPITLYCNEAKITYSNINSLTQSDFLLVENTQEVEDIH